MLYILLITFYSILDDKRHIDTIVIFQTPQIPPVSPTASVTVFISVSLSLVKTSPCPTLFRSVLWEYNFLKSLLCQLINITTALIFSGNQINGLEKKLNVDILKIDK